MFEYLLYLVVLVVFALVAYIFIERMYPHPLRVTASQAKTIIENGAKVVDVRTQPEWGMGHHPEAIHLPVSQIQTDANKLLNTKDHIIVYCNTGTRARAAATTLKDMGYQHVKYVAETYHELL